MTDIERLISRYLDRELSADEEGTFHRILSESPEARAQLREMEAIRSAARRMPSLTMPAPQLESLLFQQLFAEEAELVEELPLHDRTAIPLLYRVADVARQRTGMLVASLVLFIALGGGVWFATTQSSGVDDSGLSDTFAASTAVTSASTSSSDPSLPQAQSPTKEAIASLLPEVTESTPSRVVNVSRSQQGIDRIIHRAKDRGNAEHGLNNGSNAKTAKSTANERTEDNIDSPIPQSSNSLAQISDQNISNDSWAAAELYRISEEENEGAQTDASAMAIASELENTQTPIRYPSTEASSKRHQGEAISASYRHGVAYVESNDHQFTTQDFSLRVEGRFDTHHRLSLAVGQGPLLVERTTHTLPTAIAIKGATILSNQEEHFSQLADEVWAGIGYGYAVIAGDNIRVEPGLNVAVGERSLRLTAELPIRYHLTERFSIDLVGSISRVQPHDQMSRDVDREYAPTFLQVDEEQHPVFTSIGASIGLSFDIGR